ncbi:hypothetical protein HDU98_007821 [Podochytrium sp. JEL0797]|nr:hypothetical protein HDU98_007821 [Podochytrium sp. JEL0797]
MNSSLSEDASTIRMTFYSGLECMGDVVANDVFFANGTCALGKNVILQQEPQVGFAGPHDPNQKQLQQLPGSSDAGTMAGGIIAALLGVAGIVTGLYYWRKRVGKLAESEVPPFASANTLMPPEPVDQKVGELSEAVTPQQVSVLISEDSNWKAAPSVAAPALSEKNEKSNPHSLFSIMQSAAPLANIFTVMTTATMAAKIASEFPTNKQAESSGTMILPNTFSTLPTTPIQWSIDNVIQWIQMHDVGTPETIAFVREQEIDGHALLLLNVQDFVGMTVGRRVKLERALTRVKELQMGIEEVEGGMREDGAPPEYF